MEIIFQKVNRYSIFFSLFRRKFRSQNHALQIVIIPLILRKDYLYMDKLRTKVISRTDKSCVIVPAAVPQIEE